jgi:hypothetical protein
VGDHPGFQAVRGQRLQRLAQVRLEVGGGGPARFAVEAHDVGVALAEEELDQTVPALRPAGAVVAADPQWLLASHVSVPSLVPSGSGIAAEHGSGGV